MINTKYVLVILDFYDRPLNWRHVTVIVIDIATAIRLVNGN